MNVKTERIISHLSEKTFARFFSVFLFVSFIVSNTINLRAQLVAVKTNMADWVIASPNLSTEFIISDHFSIDFSATASPFKIKKDLYFRQIRLQPELKYWLTSSLTRHYIGITAFYSSFDLGYKEKGYFGDSYAVGVTYGYNWLLSRRWNFEISTGLGLIRYRMVRYTPGEIHQTPNETGSKILPVKLGVSFIYVLK